LAASAAPQAQPGPLPLIERVALCITIAAITALAWLYLLRMPIMVDDFGGFAAYLLHLMQPRAAEFTILFLMWSVMMVAMMLPGALPMLETYARVVRTKSAHPSVSVAIFAAAYVLIWTIFSAAATGLEFLLQRTGVIDSMLTARPPAAGAILLLGGIYQMTPLKSVCLTGCRSPIGFLMTNWRDGTRGALSMGLRHGAVCLGCCWMLMILLFVFGVMNLLWIAALTIFIVLEKLIPRGEWIARIAGVAMIAGGLAFLI
jgi:predicted metal-binding membrane protein